MRLAALLAPLAAVGWVYPGFRARPWSPPSTVCSVGSQLPSPCRGRGRLILAALPTHQQAPAPTPSRWPAAGPSGAATGPGLVERTRQPPPGAGSPGPPPPQGRGLCCQGPGGKGRPGGGASSDRLLCGLAPLPGRGKRWAVREKARPTPGRNGGRPAPWPSEGRRRHFPPRPRNPTPPRRKPRPLRGARGGKGRRRK